MAKRGPTIGDTVYLEEDGRTVEDEITHVHDGTPISDIWMVETVRHGRRVIVGVGRWVVDQRAEPPQSSTADDEGCTACPTRLAVDSATREAADHERLERP